MRDSQLYGLGRNKRLALPAARTALAQANLSKPFTAAAALLVVAAIALTGATRAADLPVLTTGHTDVGAVNGGIQRTHGIP